MTANPITVEADAPLVVAAKLMFDHKIGGLPVVEATTSVGDGMRLVGIITETDLLGYLIRLLAEQIE
jgi:acetoin utilization protein AcuB